MAICMVTQASAQKLQEPTELLVRMWLALSMVVPFTFNLGRNRD
jgi:hypothetical protein